MSTNPDKGAVIGYGFPNSYLIPSNGDLRFVERSIEEHGVPKKVRVLQVYEYSTSLGTMGWFDVPLVIEQEV